ncbi:MAG: hypothetical protein LBS49_10405 [Candidatus Accumulibacter sp.]|jgi:hypothetical protein|nr:hypothetical protein [Accumulibacter sp.]
MTPAMDAALGNLLLMGIGIALLYAYKIVGSRYVENYRQEFFENHGQRMGWDVFWMIATCGRGAPVMFVILLPVIGWLLIVIGLGNFAAVLLGAWWH